MSQEKIDSGTVILDQKGAEIGVIKKVYPSKLARLELANSESIALDLSLLTNVESTGRLLKKKNANVISGFELFFKGASETLKNLIFSNIKLLARHLSSKESSKKALQYYEFNVLTEFDFSEGLGYFELLGLIRGIELANKTAQDFIVKNVFKATEEDQRLKEILAPEIIVDKLNQEKAFYRILWNLLRICASQTTILKDVRVVQVLIEALFEIGLKVIDVEYKIGVPDVDVLYWNNRINDYITKYIAVIIIVLELEQQQKIIDLIKSTILENMRKIKVSNTIREQASKVIETFNLKDFILA